MEPLLDEITGSPVPTGAVVALGNFDGVHVGHRSVFSAALALAKRTGLKAYALTFDPHPQVFLHKKLAPLLLTIPEEKRRQIDEFGLDGVITLGFTEKLAAMTADAFIDTVLIEQCQVKHIVVGDAFVFGHDRAGTVDLLRTKLEPLGVTVVDVPLQRDLSGKVISSTRIRDALKAGDIDRANQLLGHQYMIKGTVVHGEQRGRLLGFPTANIILGEMARPKYGVYAVWARRTGEDAWFPAVANFGVRPTFENKEELFEFHLLESQGSFYGTEWDVCLAAFLREEKKFSSPERLKKQIEKDAENARTLLKSKNDK